MSVTMLKISQNIVLLQVAHYLAVDDVLENLAANTGSHNVATSWDWYVRQYGTCGNMVCEAIWYVRPYGSLNIYMANFHCVF